MEPFATLNELIARCDWTLDDDEMRAAPGYLEEASDLARAYGRLDWEYDSAPRLIKSLVISAVRRYMRNPEGYTTSRAGDETVAWTDQNAEAGAIYFTKNEQKLLRELGGKASGLRTAQVTAWGPQRATSEWYTVPVAGYAGERPFPYFSDPVEPW